MEAAPRRWHDGGRMFFQPPHLGGLPHDPLKAIIAPRPIGWIGTRDRAGRANLAPYSYFNMVGNHPPVVCFGSEGMKHSAANALATGVFTCSLVSRALFDAMNRSSGAQGEGVSEFEEAGIAAAEGRAVPAPFVALAPAALECRVTGHVALRDVEGRETGGHLVLGQVVGVHIRDEFLRGGRFDTAGAEVVARCGYRDYALVERVFEALRPTDAGAYAPGAPDR